MSGLFSECYADQTAGTTTDCAQSGCGLANFGSFTYETILPEIKKGILSASQSVLKQLRKKQGGRGPRQRKPVKRNKKNKTQQQGGGKRRPKKKQSGFGARKQKAVKCPRSQRRSTPRGGLHQRR